VRSAIFDVEARGIAYSVHPVTGLVEWYAGRDKTAPARQDLSHIEARWLRAASDTERSAIAREAELLADRVQESLPGAPQNRQRTNLYKGEQASSTPGTSYYGEFANQAVETWDVLRTAARETATTAESVARYALLGGGIVLGWKLFDYLRARERRQEVRSSGATKRALNAALEHVAQQRDARSAPKVYALRLTRGELEALQFLRGRYSSAKAFFDGLIPLDDSSDRSLSGEYDRPGGPYRFHIRRVDIRKALRATKEDGGDYGAIPNLLSDSVAWVLAQEWSASP
jgi:hypothetical protein